MAKDPAVLFYPSDIMMAFQTMTMEQRGRYITALCVQHNEHLTTKELTSFIEDDKKLWAKFIQDDKGLWYNKRWEEEKDKRQRYLDSRNVAPAHAATRAKVEATKKTKEKQFEDQVPPDIKSEEYAPPVHEPRFKPPKVKDVQKQIAGMGYRTVSAEAFVAFYDSKGWMVGKNKMKDWKQALAGWESRNKERLGVPEKGTRPGQAMDTDSVQPSKF